MSAVPSENPLADVRSVEAAADAQSPLIKQDAEAQKLAGDNSLALVQNTLTEFDKVQAGLDALRKRYGNVAYAVTTTQGMEEAKAARLAIREPRYAVDKAAKAAKAPLNDLKRNIDQRAASITAEILAIETPIHEQIRAEEDRKEAEKQAKAEAARLEIIRIQGAVDAIRNKPMALIGKGSADIEAARDEIKAIEVNVDGFGDRAGEAMQAQLQTLATLDSMHAAALVREVEDEKARKERAELAAMRAEQEAREREAAQRRASEEAAAQARADEERKRQADELAAQRAAFAREQEEARARQKAEEDRLAAERAELDRARLAEQKRLDDIAAAERAEKSRKEEVARAERERQEREEREAEEQRQTAARALMNKLQLHAQDMHDALRQWAHAEATNDPAELANARAARDAVLLTIAA